MYHRRMARVLKQKRRVIRSGGSDSAASQWTTGRSGDSGRNVAARDAALGRHREKEKNCIEKKKSKRPRGERTAAAAAVEK